MPKKITYDPKDPAIYKILRKVRSFKELTAAEIKSLATVLKMWQYKPDEIVCREGQIGSSAYIVVDGEFFLDIMDRGIKSFFKL